MLFGKAHIVCLMTIAGVSFITALIYKKSLDKTRLLILRLISSALLMLEIFRILVLTVTGNMSIGHLPLHLCSMSIPINLIAAFTKDKSLRALTGEISLMTLLPAALTALLIPDWTMYPMLNYMSLCSFIWHGLQVLFPLLLLIGGEIKPSVKHFRYNWCFLLITGIPVYIFDRIFNCNYLFLLGAPKGSPLEELAAMIPSFLYVPVLFCLYNAVILVFYLILRCLQKGS